MKLADLLLSLIHILELNPRSRSAKLRVAERV